jgi:hypothetical protein
MAITSKETGGAEYLSEFLNGEGITEMDPAEAREITSGKVDGSVKGWMPFTVSDAPYHVHWSMSEPEWWGGPLKKRAAALSDAMLRAVPKPPQAKWYDQRTGAFTDEQ